jgi:hypothetical protein
MIGVQRRMTVGTRTRQMEAGEMVLIIDSALVKIIQGASEGEVEGLYDDRESRSLEGLCGSGVAFAGT